MIIAQRSSAVVARQVQYRGICGPIEPVALAA
jgi:hypothetical protein